MKSIIRKKTIEFCIGQKKVKILNRQNGINKDENFGKMYWNMIGKRGKYRYIRFGRIIMNFRRKNMLNICLRKNKAEVVSMSLFEYDEKT